MTYASGSIILSADYNSLVGSDPATGSGSLNAVWSTGSGSAGYGQTAIAQVNVADTITSTQWSNFVNKLNSVLAHQSATPTQYTAASWAAGQIISANTFIQANLTTAYTNRLTAAAQGATGTQASQADTYTEASAAGPFTRVITRTVTFANVDAARYFFNAGGQINFTISSTTSGDNTSRSASIVNLMNNLGGITAFKANTNGGRTGSGNATLGTNSTTTGYYNISSANTTVVALTSVNTNYTSDTANLLVKTDGAAGSNNANGSTITFYLCYQSATQTGLIFNDGLSITVNHNLAVVYPETTNLSNVWGAVTFG